MIREAILLVSGMLAFAIAAAYLAFVFVVTTVLCEFIREGKRRDALSVAGVLVALLSFAASIAAMARSWT